MTTWYPPESDSETDSSSVFDENEALGLDRSRNDSYNEQHYKYGPPSDSPKAASADRIESMNQNQGLSNSTTSSSGKGRFARF